MLASYMYFFTFPYELFSEGTRMSVQCSEESSFSSTQDIQAADAAVSPRLAEAINQGAAFSLCSAWDVEPAAAIENKPVVSEIPTLLLTGDNDPATSQVWAKSTAGGLNNSYSFEFPWASHWLIFGDTPAAGCAQSMMSAFIADPVSKPDSACIDLLKVTFETQ